MLIALLWALEPGCGQFSHLSYQDHYGLYGRGGDPIERPRRKGQTLLESSKRAHPHDINSIPHLILIPLPWKKNCIDQSGPL